MAAPAPAAATIVVEGRTCWLTGARGAVYYTTRNVSCPDRMFLINGKDFARTTPKARLTGAAVQLAVL